MSFAPDYLGLKTFSTAELCDRIPGITQRQLQWWDESRLVMPRHVGHRRIYNLEQALQVAIIADLWSGWKGSMQHSYLVNIQDCLATLALEPNKKAFRQAG